MHTLLAIAAGGAVGAMARYGVVRVVSEWVEPGYAGTFSVNVFGAFALGFLVGATELRFNLDPTLRAGLAVGLLGSFTTFSTWMYEMVEQLEIGSLPQATGNLLVSLVAGVVMVMAGLALGRALG